MNTDPHPLTPAQIEPGPTTYPVDAATEGLYRRHGVRPGERALPTAATTHHHPRWRWGRSVDAASTSGAPLIMSPSDLERHSRQEAPTRPSIDDVRRRLKP